jgi:predicted MPP superfamily phosphohydrolase
MSWSTFFITIVTIIALNEELDHSKHLSLSYILFKNKEIYRGIIISIYLGIISCNIDGKGFVAILLGALSSFIVWEEIIFGVSYAAEVSILSLIAYNSLGAMFCFCAVNWLISSTNLKIITITFIVLAHLQYCSLGPIVKEVKTKWQSNNSQRIVHLSDLHIGPTCRRECTTSIVNLISHIPTDIIVITGDIIDGTASAYKTSAEPLSLLAKYAPTIMVTGNHDHHHGDVDNVVKLMTSFGITVLRNEEMYIKGLHVIGIDDEMPNEVHIDQPSVVLVHKPSLITKKIKSPDEHPLLVLSGHTHCGQMLPLMPLVWFFNYPYFCG